MKIASAIAAGVLLVVSATAQDRPPILDVHLHALSADSQGPPPLAMCTPIEPMPAWDPSTPYGPTFMSLLKEPSCPDPVWSPMTDEDLMNETLEVMERINLVGVLSGSADRVAEWRRQRPDRIIPGLMFQIGEKSLSPKDLRDMHGSGELAVLGEVTNQYVGIAPDDARMDPYWELAEKLDIPVGIHVGPGPPGVVHLGSEGYRARLHSALTLEEVLVRYPGLRVYIMHAGYPMLEDTLALMYAHPQVYVGVGVVVYTQPRAAFYRFLRGLVEAGFGNRVMFGSDQMVWPGVIERAVAVIEEAPFLGEREKRAILYDNAARFLRLSEQEISRHHRLGSPG
jgi:predicted TIM-barrel fold metal-dependent hydrolase